MLKEHKHDAVQMDTHPYNPHQAARTGYKPPGQLPKWRLAQEYPPKASTLPNLLCPSPLQTQSCPLCSLPGHSLLAPLYSSLHNFSGLKRLIFHPSWTMHAHFLNARDRTDSDIVKEQKALIRRMLAPCRVPGGTRTLHQAPKALQPGMVLRIRP